MVEMGVTNQQNFDVLEMKAELLHALLDLRHRAFEVAVDQDVALRGGDQKGSQTCAADVVDVADDLVRRKRLRPVRLHLREQDRGREKEWQYGKSTRKHGEQITSSILRREREWAAVFVFRDAPPVALSVP